MKLADEDIDAELEPGIDAAALARGAACSRRCGRSARAGAIDASALARAFPGALHQGARSQ